MRVVVLDDYGALFAGSAACKALRDAGHEVQCEREALRGAALVQACEGAEVVLLTQQRTPFPGAVVSAMSSLKWLLNTGRNLSHVDAAACSERGVRVVTAVGQGFPHNTAELTWALILAATRRVPENSASLRAGHWQGPVGAGLFGKTLGIYGLGTIGGLVAQVGAAFGMRVLCFGRPGGVGAAAAAERGYAFAHTREELFREADVLSVHLKPTPEMLGSITVADLALMKPSAVFVNTARAGLLESGALVAALRAGRPGGAALDVFDEEPLPLTDPLLGLPNVLLTPHLGYVTKESMERIYSPVVQAFLQSSAGEARL